MNVSVPKSRITNRRLIRALGLLAFVYISICVYFWATQVSKVLAPLEEIPTDPGRMGMPFEQVAIPLRVNGNKTVGHLDAFWIPVEDPDAPVFLYLHGQDATIGKNLEHTERFHQWGWNVLVLDYRGFGKSFNDEQPSEAKIYEDALAALQYLKIDRGFAANKIFIYGHSLGGAVAIDLATRPDSSDTAGLIVESSFTSVLDMSALRYRGFLRLLPISLLLTERFDALSKIGSVKLPILFIHGDRDTKVPCEMTDTLHDAARAPKQKCIIPGARHENCGSIGKVQYRKHLSEFVASCLNRGNRTSEPSEQKVPVFEKNDNANEEG